MDKIMNEINKKVPMEYNQIYKAIEKESICFNMKMFESQDNFHFVIKGCMYVLGGMGDILLRSIPCSGPMCFPKTKDCRIIISSIFDYYQFKFAIYMLKNGIKTWEKYHDERPDRLTTEYGIIELIYVKILKKEVKFMEKRLKFEKLWFTRLRPY